LYGASELRMGAP